MRLINVGFVVGTRFGVIPFDYDQPTTHYNKRDTKT